MPRKLNKDEYLAKANLKHNNKYDYSKSVYNGANNNIIIIKIKLI